MFYKLVLDGYIVAVGKGESGIPITDSQYNEIMAMLRNRPVPPAGYDYRLTDMMVWELYELPPVEEADEEISGDELLSMLEGVM